MNTKDWKQKELNRLLMEKFNLSSPELEEEAEIDDGDGVPDGADSDPKDGSKS